MNVMLEQTFELFVLVLGASWIAIPVVLLLWVVDRLVGHLMAAKYRVFLWMLLLVRLCIPPDTFAPHNQFSVQQLWQLAQYIPLETHNEPADSEHVAAATTDPLFFFDCDDGTTIALPVATLDAEIPAYLPDTQGPEDPALLRRPLQTASTEPAAAISSSASIMISYWHVLSLVWATLAIVIFLRSVVASRRFAFRLGRVNEVTNQSTIDQLLRACDAMQAGRRPRLKLVPNISSPLIYGLWRQTLCLPEEQFDKLTEKQIDLIMLHEVAHIRRRDAYLAWFLTLFRSIFWFNPFVWLAAARISQYAEEACDAMVVGNRLSERTDYADILIRFAGQHRVPNLSLAGIWFGDRKRPMQIRIRQVMRTDTSSTVWKTFGALCLLSVVAMASLTEPSDTASRPQTAQPSVADAQLQLPDVTGVPSLQFGPTIQPSLPIEERDYDLSAALQTIQMQKDCDETTARNILDQTLAGLLANFADHKEAAVQSSDDAEPAVNTEHWDFVDTTLKLRTSASGHELFDLVRPELEGNLWQVAVETRFITTSLAAVNRSTIDWRQAQLPQLEVDAHMDDGLLPRSVNNELPTFASSGSDLSVNATTTIESYTPHMAIVVSDTELEALLQSLQGDTTSNLLSAPKVTAFNAQTVTIHDETQRPFVVGLRESERPAFQRPPQIAVLPEGQRITMRPNVLGADQLDLDCQITLSNIFGVDVYQLPGGKYVDGECVEGVALQSASVKNRKINVSCRMDRQQSLVVASPGKNNAGETILSLVILTPNWFEGVSLYEEVEATE